MINYPNKQKAYKKENISTSNRGMKFEEMINETNIYYLSNNIANIHKKPTPVQIVKVDYPSRSTAKISEAYYKTPSTTDYNGVYKGYYIDFEAKETINKTSFPLSNIHLHQIKHLQSIVTHGGIGFLLIFFKSLDEIYLLQANDLIKYYNRSLTGRKSITIDEIRTDGYLIKEHFNPRIPYLVIVDKIIKEMQ